MRALRCLLLASIILLPGACATGSGQQGTTSLNRNLIEASEIDRAQRTGVRDAYELIERLRPRWLQIRNARSLQLETTVLVYHNQARLGGIEALRNFPLGGLTSIRYLDAAQAGLLPGAGTVHVQGAIVLSTSQAP